MRAAIFLDRDGVLNEEVHYLTRVEHIRLLPGAVDAVRRLNAHGVPVVVVTNQSAVARGFCTEERVDEIHQVLGRLLAVEGARVDRFYYCPHHPTEGIGRYRIACACRKPQPGLLYQAAKDLDVDLRASVMVGDKISDLETGWEGGCRTVLVLTGHGVRMREQLATAPRQPDYVAVDLAAAVEWLLSSREAPIGERS